jgi:hypothetical protein
MENKLERIWKEPVVAQFKVLCRYFLGRNNEEQNLLAMCFGNRLGFIFYCIYVFVQ